MARPSARRAGAVIATAAALALAGCSGGGVQLATLPSGTAGLLTTGAAGATGAPATDRALSPEEVAASGSATWTPFSDIPEAAVGGREVITDPTLADVLAPASALPEMSWGRDDAPVTVVKYASLTCQFCRQFHAEVFPRFKKAYIDTGKVRFILREFPIGRTSGQANVALRCVPPARYLDLYGRYLDQQPKWVSQEVRPDAIHAIAAQVGLSQAAFEACRQDAKLVEGLKLIKDRGRKLGIIGTPNFFIGNKLIKKALDFEGLAAEVDARLGGVASGPLATAPGAAPVAR